MMMMALPVVKETEKKDGWDIAGGKYEGESITYVCWVYANQLYLPHALSDDLSETYKGILLWLTAGADSRSLLKQSWAPSIPVNSLTLPDIPRDSSSVF